MKASFRLALASTAAFLMTAGIACTAKPVHHTPFGVWKQIDSFTGKANSIIFINHQYGQYRGRVLKLLNVDPRIAARDGAPPYTRCTQCKGKYHNRLVKGLVVLWGLYRHGFNKWRHGSLLDPETGLIYHVGVSLKENGKKLSVRIYKYIPMFGITQTWVRLHPH